MKKNILYKIGNISGTPEKESKYIIYKGKGNCLEFYSANIDDKGLLSHADIAKNNNLNLENVLGGGEFRIKSGTLRLYRSFGFKGVPEEVKEEFSKILTDYFKKDYKIIAREMYLGHNTEEVLDERWKDIINTSPKKGHIEHDAMKQPKGKTRR